MTIERSTFPALLGMAAFVLLQVAIIAIVLLNLADAVQTRDRPATADGDLGAIVACTHGFAGSARSFQATEFCFIPASTAIYGGG